MFFKKKKEESQKKPSEIKLQCKHKWKDFHWYIDSIYWTDRSRLELKVIEPYVCIFCKERKDIVLENFTLVEISDTTAENTFNHFKEKYKSFIRDRAIVEDEINDFQLVDREALAIVENLLRPKLKLTIPSVDKKKS